MEKVAREMLGDETVIVSAGGGGDGHCAPFSFIGPIFQPVASNRSLVVSSHTHRCLSDCGLSAICASVATALRLQ